MKWVIMFCLKSIQQILWPNISNAKSSITSLVLDWPQVNSYVIFFVSIIWTQVSLGKGTPSFEKKTNALNPLRDYTAHAKWINMVRQCHNVRSKYPAPCMRHKLQSKQIQNLNESSCVQVPSPNRKERHRESPLWKGWAKNRNIARRLISRSPGKCNRS